MEDKENTNLNNEETKVMTKAPDGEPVSAAEDDMEGLEDLTELTGLLKDKRKAAEEAAAARTEEEKLEAEKQAKEAEATEESSETEESETDAEAKTAEEKGLPEGHPEMGELQQRIDERKRYYARRKRSFRSRFYIITWTIIMLAAGFVFSISGIFTVDSIEVKGNSRFTAEEIINMGHASPGKNIIYDLNNASIEEYLKGNPYIKNAKVSRKLPSTMVIKVSERSERMAFKYDDDYLVMDEDGLLLRKSRTEPMVTIIEGIVVSKIKLGDKIGATDNDKLKRAININKKADEADLYFVRLDVSDNKFIKAYIYDTLIVKNDYDTLISNLENGRLHKLVEKLFKKGIKRGTITFDGDLGSFQPII